MARYDGAARLFLDPNAPASVPFRLFETGVARVSEPNVPSQGESPPGAGSSNPQAPSEGAIAALLVEALDAYEGLVAEALHSASTAWHADPDRTSRSRMEALRALGSIRKRIANARRAAPSLARVLSTDPGASELDNALRAEASVIARALGYLEEMLESTVELELFAAFGPSAFDDASFARAPQGGQHEYDAHPSPSAQQLQLIRVLAPRVRAIAK